MEFVFPHLARPRAMLHCRDSLVPSDADQHLCVFRSVLWLLRDIRGATASITAIQLKPHGRDAACCVSTTSRVHCFLNNERMLERRYRYAADLFLLGFFFPFRVSANSTQR